MAASRDARSAAEPAFELKGRMSTLSVLHLRIDDAAAVLAGLDERMAEAPAMFAGMPVAIDASALTCWPDEAALGELRDGLRERGLAPVALVGQVDGGLAARLGLGVMADAGGAAPPRETSANDGSRESVGPKAARVVDQPVRSGQQIYARDGDLVVLAAVSPGAEVLADGHIHVYGALNGRAMAGVQGDTNASIFCRRFNAELVAVAGHYQVSDNIGDDERGGPVRVCLRDEALTIEPLPGTG